MCKILYVVHKIKITRMFTYYFSVPVPSVRSDMGSSRKVSASGVRFQSSPCIRQYSGTLKGRLVYEESLDGMDFFFRKNQQRLWLVVGEGQ